MDVSKYRTNQLSDAGWSGTTSTELDAYHLDRYSQFLADDIASSSTTTRQCNARPR